MDRRDFLARTAATSAALGGLPLAVHAQARPKDVLIVANEFGPNSLDIHTVGANRPAYGVSWLVYDRLMTFGKKRLPDGRVTYDATKLEPELAESWQMAPDGMSVTFRLRRNATFHDGTPVTAKDVKWSFDRAVSVGGFPTFQMAAGSLEKPEQFEVVDDHTFRVKFIRKDKLTMNNLAVVVPCVFNSELVKKNATAQDPWGLNWTRNNTAGGGAYKVESFRPGQEIVYVRNDDWKCGPMPKLRRVVQREVPNAGNRRALLLRGDIDMTYDMPPKDFAEMATDGGPVKVSTMPIENAMFYVGMNTTRPPFDNVKVRQAVAWALPYDKIHEAALYGRGTKLYGGPPGPIKSTAWPQPTWYRTDLDKARALMAEAGVPNGFETTLSIDLGGATVGEPAAVLIQEALAQIGIKARINKIPGATWRAALLKKDMPMILNRFGGWLDFPEYFFYWCYHGQNAVFNTMSYQNPKLDRIITNARFAENKAIYDSSVREMIQIAYDEVPRIPLFQPSQDVAMRSDVMGFTYWFHLQPDYRQLYKA
ncbi:ABC transporter substrate-binding protein [Calidifontimicrobium sp. SYSU G02091]|uniref:ABC transporter substrate-binding protein n=1 Tax=Calidifontimicrobium sp. SYSU G02091 TaxID=2926421 RepID=UPI001F52E1DF|nr:ABC transporter substrate-binding protein [Calidifontimicrobium sp. SYSU G02091]MCI1193256.1 ABC transporter substrate-binding protein [Calidifontimicrobium sp. SYSU G02091]